MVWAVGTTCRSGTADTWLYELLQEYDAVGEFARVSGRANTARLLVSAGGIVAAAVGLVNLLVGAGFTAAGAAALLWFAVTPVRSLDGAKTRTVSTADSAE